MLPAIIQDRRFEPAERWMSIGLIAVSLGSAWYHLNPNDATLVWDRLPMAFVFALLAAVAAAIAVWLYFRATKNSICSIPPLRTCSARPE